MEPATYMDLFDNYLRYKSELKTMVAENFNIHKDNFRLNLQGNLVYQIVIARLQYRRFPEAIPKNFDSGGSGFNYALARYYKKYWNTSKGKATIAEVLRNYDKYAF